MQDAVCRIGGGNIRGWSCWDLGAHFGLYSVGLARRVGPSGKVAAFEPNPASFRKLELHRKANDVPWLKTFQAAASDSSGSAELLTYGFADSTDAHLAYRNETLGAACAPISIRTIRLDEEVASGNLTLPQFVKIDVEGHGHKALAGMRDSIGRSRPIFMIAFHSADEVDGVLSILEPLGYRRETLAAPASHPETLVAGDYLFTP